MQQLQIHQIKVHFYLILSVFNYFNHITDFKIVILNNNNNNNNNNNKTILILSRIPAM